MKPLIAGNWKMNGGAESRGEIDKLLARYAAAIPADVDILICPPAILLADFARSFSDDGLRFGAQDCHTGVSGAHTGDISAEMIAEAGAEFVIVGHSERRADHGERDDLVRDKALTAARAGLTPIVCVGESEAERRAGDAEKIVAGQLDRSLPEFRENLVVAYEPVWAIGTGLTPNEADIEAMHRTIRLKVGDKVRILYGGSVKPDNAKTILALSNVNGALVGGASLTADDFGAIIDAAR